MLFTEPSFLFYFLPALLALHAVARGQARNALLALASLVFYGWGEPVFVLGLLASIAVNHAFARILGRARPAARVLALGVAANLAFLACFKYAGFALANLSLALEALGFGALPAHVLQLAPGLPIGISFFTFQAISLLVDLHRREAPAPRNLLDTALYISMFAQLIAGPIVRYADLAPQLRERRVDVHDFAAGARRFCIGLGKKLLLAEALAVPADRVFELAEQGLAAGLATPGLGLSAGIAWLGLLCFALQIYLDFSAYSDMAIGLARMFGFHYRENFEHPYAARSLTEFWRRWHISLSTWFRDYLYIPLGGGRVASWRVGLNLTLVFLLCGLWHGAAWTFVLWGALHGIGLASERILPLERFPRGAAPLRRALTLLFVGVAWIPFRSEGLAGAGAMLEALVGAGPGDPRVLGLAHLVDPQLLLVLGASLIACDPRPARWFRETLSAWEARRGVSAFAASALECAAISLLLFACAARIAAGGYQPFLYFRF